MGRPPKHGDKAMAARLEIRVDPAEKAAYVAAARAAGMKCSDWIRATLNAAATKKPRGRSPPRRDEPRRRDSKKAEEE